MIEKKNRENYPKNAFGQKKKKEETWVKPGLAVILVFEQLGPVAQMKPTC